MNHPFPFITELNNVEKITGFNDTLKIMNFVYNIVPWIQNPYTDLVRLENIESLYSQFGSLKTGGWCGLNAEFFKWIIEGYRRQNSLEVQCRSYNYGILKNQITHIGVIVEVDQMEFFLDPYFNRYYVHKDGFPLQLKDLLYLIRERKTEKYRSVFLNGLKPVIDRGSVYYLTPQELLKEIISGFEINNFSQVIQNTFNSTNPDLLMLLKIPD